MSNNNGFIPTGTGNYYLEADGFWVSYNPAGGDETALVVGGNFYILNGDFREEYATLANKGLKECLEFYLSRDFKSSWSDDEAVARELLEELK